MGEEEIRCSYDDSSLEQYLLLILRYDYPKTSIIGACLPFSSNTHEAGSHAARHVNVVLPQRTPVLNITKAEAAVLQPPAVLHQPLATFASRVQRPRSSKTPECLHTADLMQVHMSQAGSPPVRAQISKATCKHTTQRAEPSLSFSLTPSDHSTCLLCHLHHRRAHLRYA